MSKRSENQWNDIETLLDERRVEEEALLAVLEALGEWDDLTADEFAWDEPLSDESPMDSRPGGDLSMNAISA